MSRMIKNPITRRDFMRSVPSFFAAAAAASCSRSKSQKKPERRPPNVLFIFADQLRADICGAYGDYRLKNILTPNIDRLAGQGVTFTNALSSAPKCTPFRGMLMTGKYPTHSGLVINFVHVSPEQNPDCIANIFARNNYETAFIGKWHLAAGGWRNPGHTELPDITDNFVPPGPARLGFQYWAAYNFHSDFNNYYYYHDEDKRIFSEKFETDTLVDQAIGYMESRKNSDKPFFLMVAPHPPHPPYRPSHTPEGYLKKVVSDPLWSPNVPEEERIKHKKRLRCYLAMCKNLDDGIGRLMKFLDESDLSEDTLVVFTSDHGEMHGSHGRYNKKVPFAESVDIPLFLRWPGVIPAGQKVADLYTPMDHLPTLCTLCGLEIPDGIDGDDLSDAVLNRAGRVQKKEALMATYVSGYNTFTSGKPYLEWRGVHTGRWTYFRWLRYPDHLKTDEEMYDNNADPYQMKNLVFSEGHSIRLDSLRSTLARLLAEAHDEFLPGTAYADWYDADRRLIRTAMGPVGKV